MKYVFPDDVAVRIWREEREGLPEYAHFYKGIFEVMILEIIHVTFIPAFPRTPDKWPPVLPPDVDVDIVESEEQARLFTVLFSEYIVTPNEELAGQKELVPQPIQRTEFPFGVIFYVTPEQFALFSEELLDIELNYQNSGSRCARLSQIKHFESMKFILNQIDPFDLELRSNGYTLPMNGILFHELDETILTTNGTKIERDLNGSHHETPKVATAIAA